MAPGRGCRGVRGYWGLHMKYEDGLLQSTLETQDILLQKIEHELRLTGLKLGPFWPPDCSTRRALTWHGVGKGVYLTKHQPDPQVDDMSCWPAVVPLLTTRCLYWEWRCQGLTWGQQGCRWHWGVTHEKWRQSIANYCWKLQSIADNRTWGQINWTQVHTTLGHQMPLLGGHLTECQPDPKNQQMSRWPNVVPFWATRCLYCGVCLSSGQLDPC